MASEKKKMVEDDFSQENSKRPKTSNGFEGLVFCVLDDNPKKPDVPPLWPPKKENKPEEPSTSKEVSALLSKTELRERLKELGASVADCPTKDTYAVATFQPDTLRVKLRKELKTHLLVHASWLCQCVEAKKLRPPAPIDCLFADEKPQETWVGKYDRFGDSFTQDVDAETLKKIFDNMGEVTPPEEDRQSFAEEVNAVKAKVLKDTSLFPFSNLNVYLDTMDTIGDPSTEQKNSSLEITALDIQRFYGRVSKVLNKGVTHVICEKRERASAFEKEKREKGLDFHLVSPEWVDECMSAGRILDENLFRLV